jgi:hypothetical protein
VASKLLIRWTYVCNPYWTVERLFFLSSFTGISFPGAGDQLVPYNLKMSPNYSVAPSQVFRTPDSRFEGIPDFPYAPRYDYFHGLRYAFIDESSGVLHNGKELSPSELTNVSQGDIQWETYLCLQ